MRPRPRKNQRIVSMDSSDDDDNDSNEQRRTKVVDVAVSTEIVQRPRNAGKSVAVARREKRTTNVNKPIRAEGYDDETYVPFCCAVCHCAGPLAWFQPDEEQLWHRRCCHGHRSTKGKLSDSTPHYTAREEASDCTQIDGNIVLDFGNDPPTFPISFEWITNAEIKQQYDVAKNQEAEMYNDDSIADPRAVLLSHSEYAEGVIQPFEQLKEQIEANGLEKARQDGMVVLDCFAGIGTAIVVLMKLGIKIRKVIRVEHDKIATHVYRHYHDCEYNSELPRDGGAGIEHVYLEKFEELENDGIDKLLEEHGPIDLIIGGPPCIDYSAVNAGRQGTRGVQGSYLLRFGRLIRYVERLQERSGQQKLFFLVENVFLREQDLVEIRDAFGIDWNPFEFDASYVSPTRRLRHFITNIPILMPGFEFDGPARYSTPIPCLEEGFVLPGQVWEKNMRIAKAACFMASSSRIDERESLRMYVCDEKPKRDKVEVKIYHGRPFNINERELMMGYPANYVRTPVYDLFNTLSQDGHGHLIRVDWNRPETWRQWRLELHKKFHTFAGNYHRLAVADPYRFAHLQGALIMRMAPPQTTKTPSFFDAEEYSKHLVGLAYSVPVVELLLAPLKTFFPQRSYVGYCYRYPWEAAQDDDGKEDARSCLQQKSSSVRTNSNEVDDRKMPARSTPCSHEPLPPAISDDGRNEDQDMAAAIPKRHRGTRLEDSGADCARIDDGSRMKMPAKSNSVARCDIHISNQRKPAPTTKAPPSGSSWPHDSDGSLNNNAANTSRKRRLTKYNGSSKPSEDCSQSPPSVDAPIPRKNWKTKQT